MAVPEHVKIVFRGTVLNTPEIWTISLKFLKDQDGVIEAHADDFQANGVLNAGQSFFGQSLFANNLRWEEWRAYDIGSSGNMVGNPVIHPLTSGEYVVGGGSAPKYPPQVAVCVTSVANNRGPGRYGRFFLPCIGTALGTDSRMSLTDATNFAEGASTFVKSISGALDLDATIANAALVNISSIGAGSHQNVDHLSVGRVLDTQRRRRNALVEEPYSTGNIDW